MIIELTIKINSCKPLIKRVITEKTNCSKSDIERVKLEWLTNYINRDRHPSQKSYPSSVTIARMMAGGIKSITGKII